MSADHSKQSFLNIESATIDYKPNDNLKFHTEIRGPADPLLIKANGSI
jgi:hypothetical protein